MCGSSPKPPPPPPAPPPVNPVQAPNVLQRAEGTKRSDSSTAMRGRNSLRIDRSASTLGGGGGTGLNIPS